IRAHARAQARIRSLGECRASIRELLLARARAARLTAWRDGRRRAAEIARFSTTAAGAAPRNARKER
ncbi:MAG: hypothetical protein ACRD26_15445, partial [Vicinamibacterales bacterium]